MADLVLGQMFFVAKTKCSVNPCLICLPKAAFTFYLSAGVYPPQAGCLLSLILS
jgi:hypothetical protein